MCNGTTFMNGHLECEKKNVFFLSEIICELEIVIAIEFCSPPKIMVSFQVFFFLFRYHFQIIQKSKGKKTTQEEKRIRLLEFFHEKVRQIYYREYYSFHSEFSK